MAKDKRLGSGMSALFDSITIDEPDESAPKTVVPLSRVEPRPDQPRKAFDEERLEELAESIKMYGIIQPITVREIGEDRYQIIAGERRWRAAKMAGIDEIPVNIIEADDRTAQELSLIENLQREDLNPIEEARGYQTLMMEFGLTQEEASHRVGKSRPAIANTLRLLQLPETILEYLEDGMLSPGHARVLIPLADPELQISTANQIMEKDLSVRQTEALVKKMLTPAKNTQEAAEDASRIDYAQIMCDQLGGVLGRKVNIHDGRRRGKIEIEYYGADDREALIAQLMKLK